MKALITGGAGFIGSHTAEALLRRGCEVRILDSLEPRVHRGRWPRYLAAACDLVRGDVRDRQAVAAALEGIEVVCHFAAHQDYLPDFSRFFDVNATGTALVYELIVERRLPVRKVIVASSQAAAGEGLHDCPVHGETFPDSRPRQQLEAGQWDLRCPRCQGLLTPLPTPEAAANPQNAYGLSKLAQERLGIGLGRRYAIPTVALRYSTVQGPRQSFRHAYSGACRIFSLSCYLGRQPVIYEDGLQLRDFVNIGDVVAANLLVLDRSEADYQVFNVGGGTAWTVLDFARAVAAAYRLEFAPALDGRFRFGDTRHALSDVSKLRALGWEPTVPVGESVRQYRDWLRSEVPPTQVLAEAERQMESLDVIGRARTQQAAASG